MASRVGLPPRAEVGVGADEQAPALVVDDDLVQERVGGSAERAGAIPPLHFERMVLEVQASYRGVGRHRVDSLLATRTEEEQRRVPIELRIVEFRDGRR